MSRILRSHSRAFPSVPDHSCCSEDTNKLCGATYYAPVPLPAVSCSAEALRFGNRTAGFRVNQSVLVRRYNPNEGEWSDPLPGTVKKSRLVPVSTEWFGRLYTVAIICPHCSEELRDNYASHYAEISATDPQPSPQEHLVYACIPSPTEPSYLRKMIWVPSLLYSLLGDSICRIRVMMGPSSTLGREYSTNDILPYNSLTARILRWSEDQSHSVFGDGETLDLLISEKMLAALPPIYNPKQATTTAPPIPTYATSELLAVSALLDMSAGSRTQMAISRL